jgi:hypothetical protein
VAVDEEASRHSRHRHAVDAAVVDVVAEGIRETAAVSIKSRSSQNRRHAKGRGLFPCPLPSAGSPQKIRRKRRASYTAPRRKPPRAALTKSMARARWLW